MFKFIQTLSVTILSLTATAQDKPVPLDKNLSTITYPFPVKYYAFTSQKQQLRMAYMDANRPANANGKTVLLLHGKNFNGTYWEQTIKELNKNGFRVIVPDQIGFGKSTKPEQYQYSFHQLAANTKAILDTLKIKKVIVLGHSMGGMLATRFALMYPDVAEQLVLEDPIGLEDYKTLAPYQSIDSAYKTELKNTPATYRAYQQKNYYHNEWKPGYDRWLNLLSGWTLHKDYPIIAWNAALTSDMIYTQPVVYEFKNIKVPTIIIIGLLDRTAIGKERAPANIQPLMGMYNELGKKTQQAIPGSELVEIEGVGHLPHIEAFERFIQPLLEFIGR